MGVPKFFRYISERYPCLSELIRENQVPHIDNLYLDMNGIIHNCSHPNDSDVYFRICEEQIFKDIFHYLEFLFRMIRPQKLFFIAIDGVAPRAKMNQQRGRRFRSAREAIEQIEKAEKSGEVLPIEERFDSNCITPGTAFMVRLQEALKHFMQIKISTNPLWKHCKVILSGHETPGEGEHKIMEYIRFSKSKTDFDVNTRHCLYGLDADLIMLGLCTHERHFSLLREEVKFGKQDKKSSLVEETRFYLLHLSLMREYLELEFSSIQSALSFGFDIEKLIDDWVLLGYLIGNDFIPHMPHLHINENAFPIMYGAYKEVLPKLDGYINEAGILNLARFEVFMQHLGQFDRITFKENYTDLKYLETKRSADNVEAFEMTIDEIKAEMDVDLTAMIRATEEMYMEDKDYEVEDIENDPELFEKEFHLYKRNYYMTKLKYDEMTPEVLAEQTECYIRALQWTLSYYYRGVMSWAWYYPHHYAPFISDVQSFKHLNIKFEMGKPFLPFQQLLSVLPAASKSHLPEAYHKLMTDPQSPVIDYYPETFESDLNGKNQAWEAVVLIPFIEENRLLDAMRLCDVNLTPNEKARNIHGPMLQYQYCDKSQGSLSSCYGFPYVEQLHCSTHLISRDDLYVPESKLVLGPSKGANLDCYYPGFPTMKHLVYFGELKKARVKVFNQPSRNDSMIIKLDNPVENFKETSLLATEMLGKTVYVSWPHLTEAKIVGISDHKKFYDISGNSEGYNDRRFQIDTKTISEHQLVRLGIDMGQIKQIVHAKVNVGHEYIYDGKYTMKKLWSQTGSAFPIHAIVENLKTIEAAFKPTMELKEAFPVGAPVFLIGTEYYGSMGEVVEVLSGKSKIKVQLTIYTEPQFKEARKINQEAKNNYMNSYDAASLIGISSNILTRVTGTILVVPGKRRSLLQDEPTKQNVGLQLRLVSKDEETVGFTKKNGTRWFYSEKVVGLVRDYYEKIPELFEKLESGGKCDMFFEEEIFYDQTGDDALNLKGLVAWLKTQDHVKAERRTCGTQLVEKEAIEKVIVNVADSMKINPTCKIVFVPPILLFTPGLVVTSTCVDFRTDFELFDRVIIVRNSEVVPFGYRGTIVGIHFIKDPNPIRQECLKKIDKYFDILFDKEFNNGVSVYCIEAANNRVARVSEAAVVNISFGIEVNDNKSTFNDKPMDTQPLFATPDAQDIMSMNTSQTIGTYAKPNKQDSSETLTAEIILKRLNERIEKKNPNKKITITNHIESDKDDLNTSSKSREDFEKIWTKLKETPQVPAVITYGNSNLWKPTTVAHDLQPTDTIVIQDVQQVESIETSASATTPAIISSENSTDALKKALRILDDGDNVSENPVVVSPNLPIKSVSNHESHPKVNIEEMFKMHTKKPNAPQLDNLPKPPLTWRNNSTTTQKKMEPTNNPPQQQHFQKSKMQHAPIHPPQQTYSNAIFPHFMNHSNPQQQPTVRPPMINYRQQIPPQNFPYGHMPPPNFQMPMNQFNTNYRNYQPAPPHANFNYIPYTDTRQRPNGPQNLSYNRNVPGNGAFVPLQAVMKNVKPKNSAEYRSSQQQMHHQLPPQSNAFVQKNAEQRQKVEQKQEENKQNFATFLSQEITHPVVSVAKLEAVTPITDPIVKIEEKTAKPPPRQSRIAANFSAT